MSTPYEPIATTLRAELADIKAAGLTKSERVITTAQGAQIATNIPQAPKAVLNFCANNYLGLANHPQVLAAAARGLEQWGFGLSSVRFICGTQTPHHQLEQELSEFLGTEDSLLFSSCFDANGAIFDVLLTKEDAVISDALNHASIIDGIRLCKAARYRYANRDMNQLRECLTQARQAGARRILVVTDGVFSMDGYYAPLPEICDLAGEYGALVMVDDSHATGAVGPGGRGTPELFGVMDRVDILSGTLGKALGGAQGGYIAAHREIIEILRQRGRPYLFSNALAPTIVAGSAAALKLARTQGQALRENLYRNTELFRKLMNEAGFEILEGAHPIVAVMFRGDDGARHATSIAAELLKEGIYVTAFSFPVVPKGQARIRVQLSAAHREDQVRTCVEAFIKARKICEN